MPSDKFLADYLDLTPSEYLTLSTRYFGEKFPPDDRDKAFSEIMNAFRKFLYTDDDEEEPEVPRLLSMPVFMEEIGEPPEATVPHFIPAKKLICLSGAAKQGKSLVALEMMTNIALGENLFGEFEVKRPGPVVYFGFEDGAYEIKERLMTRGKTDIPNFFICWQGFDFGSAEGFKMFKRMIRELPEPPELVVIDTARHAFETMKDWNDNTEVGKALRKLLGWSHKNCTVILITHNNKDKFATGGNKIAGAGALVSTCDGFMLLENQRVLENGDLLWDWEMSGRGVKRQRCKLQMDTQTLCVTYLDKDAVKDAAAEEHRQEKDESKETILRFAEGLEYFTSRSMADLTELSQRRVADLIKELVDSEKLQKGMLVKEEGSRRPAQSFLLKKDCADIYGNGPSYIRDPVSVINQEGATTPAPDSVGKFFAEEETEGDF